MEMYNEMNDMNIRGSPPYPLEGIEGTPAATPTSIGQKRKRITPGTELTSDQEEHGEHGEEQGTDRTRHVPKRACNECRQQKVGTGSLSV